MTETPFDGLSISEEDKIALSANILTFPTKSTVAGIVPDEKMKQGVTGINNLFAEDKLQGLFAITLDTNQDIKLVVAGGAKNVNSYLIISAILDAMRNDMIERTSPVLFPKEKDGK